MPVLRLGEHVHRNFLRVRDAIVQSGISNALVVVAGVQGLFARLHVLKENERPRSEVEPVKIGRQRPVRAVQHGKTLTSATIGGDE